MFTLVQLGSHCTGGAFFYPKLHETENKRTERGCVCSTLSRIRQWVWFRYTGQCTCISPYSSASAFKFSTTTSEAICIKPRDFCCQWWSSSVIIFRYQSVTCLESTRKQNHGAYFPFLSSFFITIDSCLALRHFNHYTRMFCAQGYNWILS